MTLLTIENLTTGYEKDPVIDAISLEIPRGTFFGVIGPNGAGKTTLFRAISKVLKPWSGSIRLDGKDISNLSRKEFARRVSVIPQFQTILPPFTVGEFVSLGRYPHIQRLSSLGREDHLIVEETLELLDIASHRNKTLGTLSGGEMQRVFLAQGLVQRPELLLMDEPTSHLDITHQIKLLDQVMDLSKTMGLTVLIILHDLNLTSAYCEHIALMKNGSVFAKGTPAEVLTLGHIEEVYETRVLVREDPVISRPHIFFIPGQFLRKSK